MQFLNKTFVYVSFSAELTTYRDGYLEDLQSHSEEDVLSKKGEQLIWRSFIVKEKGFPEIVWSFKKEVKGSPLTAVDKIIRDKDILNFINIPRLMFKPVHRQEFIYIGEESREEVLEMVEQWAAKQISN